MVSLTPANGAEPWGCTVGSPRGAGTGVADVNRCRDGEGVEDPKRGVR